MFNKTTPSYINKLAQLIAKVHRESKIPSLNEVTGEFQNSQRDLLHHTGSVLLWRKVKGFADELSRRKNNKSQKVS